MSEVTCVTSYTSQIEPIKFADFCENKIVRIRLKLRLKLYTDLNKRNCFSLKLKSFFLTQKQKVNVWSGKRFHYRMSDLFLEGQNELPLKFLSGVVLSP